MSKTRLRRASRKPLYVILALSLFIAISYVGFRTLYPPTPASIFLVDTIPLEYGDTTISGTLRKDSPVGEDGKYLLILSDSRPVLLDAQGVDNLLGLSISVTGYLLPTDGDTPISMTVNTITTQ